MVGSISNEVIVFSISLILPALVFTQSFNKNWIPGIFLGSKGQWVHKADNLTMMSADFLENVGFLTLHNPTGPHGLLQGLASLFFNFLWVFSGQDMLWQWIGDQWIWY
jgi:hypothetical protein